MHIFVLQWKAYYISNAKFPVLNFVNNQFIGYILSSSRYGRGNFIEFPHSSFFQRLCLLLSFLHSIYFPKSSWVFIVFFFSSQIPEKNFSSYMLINPRNSCEVVKYSSSLETLTLTLSVLARAEKLYRVCLI
jgi:hypothetical protein